MLSPMQCRAARAALSMSANVLAELSNVHANTISRFEKGGRIRDSSSKALQHVFEDHGILFVIDGFVNQSGEGLHLPNDDHASVAEPVSPSQVAVEPEAEPEPEPETPTAPVTPDSTPSGRADPILTELFGDTRAFCLRGIAHPIWNPEALAEQRSPAPTEAHSSMLLMNVAPDLWRSARALSATQPVDEHG